MGTHHDHLTFDVVIVGGGPSAAGLLRGLLLRVLRGECDQNLRIAVLERGSDAVGQGNSMHSGSGISKQNPKIQKTKESFNHSHSSTHSLRTWFTAAHYTSKPTKHIIIPQPQSLSQTKSPSPTVLHTTTPQTHLNNRIIDVPTGTGWGGTTNIHAGLAVEPWYGVAGSNSGSGDFANWPGRWKGGQVVKAAIKEVLNALKDNDALGNTAKKMNCDAAEPDSVRSFIEVCSGGRSCSAQAMMFGRDEGGFRGVTTTSSPLFTVNHQHTGVINEDKKDTGAEAIPLSSTSHRRMNYFSALIGPLLQNHPELEQNNVSFLSGVQVERVLVGCSHCALYDAEQEKCSQHSSINSENLQCTCGDGSDNIYNTRAWAVECLVFNPESSKYNRLLIRSRQELVLCAGAVGSPALLLASGIGHEDDLREAGIQPWYHRLPSTLQGRCFRNLPVGRNLRDHIILPRTFITSRQRQSTLSCNSIHGSWLCRLSMDAKCSTNETLANIELQLADGVQMDAMIPHFAAGAFRRLWSLPILNYGVPITWINDAFNLLRHLLNRFFGCHLIRSWTRLHMASINVCLLNPKTFGRVTVVSQTHCCCHFSGQRAKTANTDASFSSRLSNCEVLIDPSYLSNPRDLDALWIGWKVSSDVKRQCFGSCNEVLPGLLLVSGLKLVRWLSSLLSFRWFASPLSYDGWANEECGEHNRPVWFSDYVAEFANPYYHWCGTCVMGNNIDRPFVVDDLFCVRGISGLRVCDASVFPSCVSAPTSLTCAGLGMEASKTF